MVYLYNLAGMYFLVAMGIGGFARRGNMPEIFSSAARVNGSHFSAICGGIDATGVGRPSEALISGEKSDEKNALKPVHKIKVSLCSWTGLEPDVNSGVRVKVSDEIEVIVARCIVISSPFLIHSMISGCVITP